MPVQSCNEDGKPGYKYGESGACYTYSPGDEAGRKKAKQKAYIQGAAIAANTGEPLKKEDASAFEDILDETANLEKADNIRYERFIDDGEGLIITYPEDEKKPAISKEDRGSFSPCAVGMGTDGKPRKGVRWASSDGTKSGECHQYIPGDRKSEDAAILAAQADQDKWLGAEKGIDVQDLTVPGTTWKGKKRSEMTLQELEECKKARRAAGCPKVRKAIGFQKMDEEQRLVYGIVLVPDVEDLQGDIVSKEDIEAAAHDYLVNSRLIKAQHRAPTDADVVESYITPDDTQLGKGIAPAGSWIMVTKVHSNAMWDAIKKGDITGYSIGGIGTREQIQEE
jgi:hypothetical protein